MNKRRQVGVAASYCSVLIHAHSGVSCYATSSEKARFLSGILVTKRDIQMCSLQNKLLEGNIFVRRHSFSFDNITIIEVTCWKQKITLNKFSSFVLYAIMRKQKKRNDCKFQCEDWTRTEVTHLSSVRLHSSCHEFLEDFFHHQRLIFVSLGCQSPPQTLVTHHLLYERTRSLC